LGYCAARVVGYRLAALRALSVSRWLVVIRARGTCFAGRWSAAIN
jgi:hypothetical protein